MVDLTVTASVPGSRWILHRLEELLSWARMSFNPSKSRSLVLQKGKVVDKFCFTISETTNPTLTEQPVKNLGKLFDFRLWDWRVLWTAIHKTHGDLEAWFIRVYKSGLGYTSMPSCPGWYGPCYCMTFSCQLWKQMWKKISSYLRMWLGLSRSLCCSVWVHQHFTAPLQWHHRRIHGDTHEKSHAV